MRILGIVTTPAGHRAEALLESALGKPLLAYTAQAALGSHRLSRAVLFSDSPVVRAAGEELGFEIGPREAGGEALGDLQAMVRDLEAEEGRRCDGVMLLPAIHPLRNREDIDGAIQLLERTGADAVASLVQRRPQAGQWAGLDAEGRVLAGPERSSAGKGYLRDGSIRCCRRRLLMEANSLDEGDCRAWLMPPERSCAVEDDFDLFLLEQLMRYPGQARL